MLVSSKRFQQGNINEDEEPPTPLPGMDNLEVVEMSRPMTPNKKSKKLSGSIRSPSDSSKSKGSKVKTNVKEDVF